MKRQTLRHFVVMGVLLGPLLGASLSGAQSKIPLRPMSQHPASLTSQPTYTFTLLNYPGTLSTLATGINPGATTSKMEIVGGINLAVFGHDTQTQGGFLARVSGKKMFTETYQAFNDPHVPPQQGAVAVNDSGDIIGSYLDSSGNFHAFERIGAKFSNIDVPFTGATETFANGINNSGEIVGAYEGSDGLSHGFTLVGGTYTSFDYPGGTQTFATAINSSGAIVGQYRDGSGWHGFLLSAGTYTPFDYPGATAETFPAGINDNGDISGFYCVTEECVGDLSGAQGFLLSGGTFTEITIPGEFYTVAFEINNNGVIVGYYQDAAGVIGSFLATP